MDEAESNGEGRKLITTDGRVVYRLHKWKVVSLRWNRTHWQDQPELSKISVFEYFSMCIPTEMTCQTSVNPNHVRQCDAVVVRVTAHVKKED